MHNKAYFANSRTLAAVRRLLSQLERVGALLGRDGYSLVVSAPAAATMIGDAWDDLLCFRLHGEHLSISYSVFSGADRRDGFVSLTLGALARMPEAPEDVPRADEVRELLLAVPLFERDAMCA